MTMRRMTALFGAIAALLLVASTGYAQDATVQVRDHDQHGEILVDSDGMTLYVFEPDSEGESACADDCADAWPPLTVEADTEPTAGDGVTGDLSTFERADGSMQTAYNGMPLYTFARDTSPGDATGQGVDGFGGEWYVVPVGASTFQEARDMSQAGMAEGEAEATGTPEAEMDASPTPEAEDEQPEQLPATGVSETLPLSPLALILAGVFVTLVGLVFRRQRT